MTKKKLDFLPNSTTFPNSYIDQIMYLLDGDEWKIVSYAIRRIIGFHKRADNISLSQFCDGIQNKDGVALDYGTGLSTGKARKALQFLTDIGLLLQAEKNDPTKNRGAKWALQLDGSKVKMDILLERAEKKFAKNSAKMAKIRAKRMPRKEGDDDVPPTVAKHAPPTVAKHAPPTVAKQDNKQGKKEKESSAKKQKTAESPVFTDQEETDTFLQELRERETKTTYKKKIEKIIQSPLGISNAIYAGEQVTAEDMAATRGETIESRLSGWRDDKIRMVVEAFARAYGKLPPAAPDKNAKNPHAAKYQFYWEWRNGAKLLTEIHGEGDLIQIIKKRGAEYDGFDGIQSPYSIRNQVYADMNTALETPKYTNGNRIGV